MNDLVVSSYTALGRQDLGSFLADVAEAGHEWVEVLAAQPHIDLEDVPGSAQRLGNAARVAGVTINSVVPSGVDVNLASTQAGMRQWSVEQFVAAVRLAALVGAPQALVHPGRRHPLRPPPVGQLRNWVVEGLAEVADVAEAEGVQLLLENVPTGLLDSASDCAELADELGGRLRLCYDVANGFMVEDVPAGLTAAGPSLGLLHLSDTTRTRWLHDPIGRGDVPFEQVLAIIQDLGWTGRIVLETLHDESHVEGFAADRSALERGGWGVVLTGLQAQA